jgi:hypothetical protein
MVIHLTGGVAALSEHCWHVDHESLSSSGGGDVSVQG